VQHKAQLLRARAAHILVNHPPIRVERAVGRILAADECEPHGPVIACFGRRQRAADTAHVPCFIDEAIPIFARRLKAGGEKTACPIRGGTHVDFSARDDMREGAIARDFDHQAMTACFAVRRTTRPQDHAVGRRIARGDALRVKISPFRARIVRPVRATGAERKRGASCRRLRQ